MKIKMLSMILAAALAVGLSGCAGDTQKEPVEKESAGEGISAISEEDTKEEQEPEEEEESGEDGFSDKEESESVEEESAASEQPEAETEELEGNVRSLGADSFVMSRTYVEHYEDHDLAVAAAPGSDQEELVTVYVNDDASYIFKTVKNSGINPEDITSREGSYSDLKEELAVTLKGHWEGESFYADEVVMMEFIR